MDLVTLKAKAHDFACDFVRSIVARLNAVALALFAFAQAYPQLPNQLIGYLPEGAAAWAKPALIVGWAVLVQWGLRRDRAKTVERVQQS